MSSITMRLPLATLQLEVGVLDITIESRLGWSTVDWESKNAFNSRWNFFIIVVYKESAFFDPNEITINVFSLEPSWLKNASFPRKL